MNHTDQYELVTYCLTTKHFSCKWSVDVRRDTPIENVDGPNCIKLVCSCEKLLTTDAALHVRREGSEMGPPTEVLILPEGTTIA